VVEAKTATSPRTGRKNNVLDDGTHCWFQTTRRTTHSHKPNHLYTYTGSLISIKASGLAFFLPLPALPWFLKATLATAPTTTSENRG